MNENAEMYTDYGEDYLPSIGGESNFLNFKHGTKIEYSVEPKIDGISASLNYKNGVLNGNSNCTTS